jgi:SnoaL-like domain
MSNFTVREQIVETVHKLFIYTDQKEWQKIQDHVFTAHVLFDMSSLGMEVVKITSKNICETWEKGFTGLDAVNHLAGNILVKIAHDQADVFAYATATHFKSAAMNGKTREFVGTYDLHLVDTVDGWRINEFKYNLKYMNGNLELK